MLSINAELLELWITSNFLWIAFSAASLVKILLVVSHPVSGWSAGKCRVSLSPSAVLIMEWQFWSSHSENQLHTQGSWWQDEVRIFYVTCENFRTFMTLPLGDTMSLCAYTDIRISWKDLGLQELWLIRNSGMRISKLPLHDICTALGG